MKASKPLLIATLVAATGLVAVSTDAAAGDPALGALIGGGIGAVVGHNVGHGGGATAAGAVVGALVGSSVAASSNYYGQPYYDGGYAPAPAYGPAPVYSAPVYSQPVYQPYYAAPVYEPYYAAPVYEPYYAAPVYAAPTVVIGTGYGGHYYEPRHHGYRHWEGHRH